MCFERLLYANPFFALLDSMVSGRKSGLEIEELKHNDFANSQYEFFLKFETSFKLPAEKCQQVGFIKGC